MYSVSKFKTGRNQREQLLKKQGASENAKVVKLRSKCMITAWKVALSKFLANLVSLIFAK